MSPRLVYMTFPSREAALPVARHLVEAKLAACANLLSPMTSVYRWDGRIAEESEVVVIAKTSEDRMPLLRAAVLERHPYSVPCIVALAIDAALSHAPFIDWIVRETTVD